MVKNIYSLFTTLFFLGALSFNVYAAGSNISELSNISIQGLKTLAVEVNMPTGGAYGDLKARGMTKVKLEENVSKQLQAAGFNIIGVNDAQNDPSAALIEVRIRVVRTLGVVYSTSVNITMKQKVYLGQNTTTSFYADAWTGGVTSGLSQNDLSSINTYVRELIDDFIKVHQVQN
jgi:hypothetical protein